MKINHAMLGQKLNALAVFSTLDTTHIKRLGDILTTLSDWELRRIDPLDFAAHYDLDENAAIDLFVHATKVGLFDFEWNTICPMCGSIEHQHTSLHQLNPEAFHCTMCDIDVPTELDSQIEVTFTINPGIAELELDPFADIDSYRRYYTSAHFHPPQQFEHFMNNKFIRNFITVAPDDTTRLTFKAEPGSHYRILSLDKHLAMNLYFTDQTSDVPHAIEADILPADIAPQELTLDAGRVTIHLHNLQHTTVGALLTNAEAECSLDLSDTPTTFFSRYFTGKMLLNNQSFRELFRIQALPDDLQFKISNLTILFTDLKNSTELYSRTGDINAYRLVQDHFAVLTQTARKHSGAVIKTIGDAVMAAFSTPSDGITAAIDMLDAIAIMNERTGDTGDHLALKIGVHTGSALAVKANEILDYFGQTVNISARVQSLAEVGEIWITDEVYLIPQVQSMLADTGYVTEKQSAMLRGIGEPVTVYKCEIPPAH